jgi:ubiquinone/menaquinone biosynthesis C-methylase UbiE
MSHSEISRVTRTKEQAIASYDRLSRWYDWLSAGSERPLTELGLKKLNVNTGETVLEIGFGTGHALLALAACVGYLTHPSVFWDFRQKFCQPIAIFRPGRVRLFSEYTPKSLDDRF